MRYRRCITSGPIIIIADLFFQKSRLAHRKFSTPSGTFCRLWVFLILYYFLKKSILMIIHFTCYKKWKIVNDDWRIQEFLMAVFFLIICIARNFRIHHKYHVSYIISKWYYDMCIFILKNYHASGGFIKFNHTCHACTN